MVDGTERLFAEAAIGSILERQLPEAARDLNLETFSPESLDLQKLQSAASAMPFLAEHRVVVLRDAGALRAAERKGVWEVAQSVPEGNTLVLEDLTVVRKGTKPETFASLAGRTALRIDTTPTADGRVRFIDETLRSLGATAEPRVVATLAGGESDLGAVRTDLEKLALLDTKITFAHLEAEMLATVEPKAWQYAAALVEGRPSEALAHAAELFDRERGAGTALMGALAAEYDLIWQVVRGMELEPRFRWRAGKLAPLARRLGERRARRGFELAVRGFEAIVTGRVEDPKTIVELVTSEASKL
ncbi:MAG: DNA polymerase III subunit delta [Vulcanimicrobiaceae bacterium]